MTWFTLVALVLSAGLALAQPAATPQPLKLKSSFFKGQMVSFDGVTYTQAYKSERLEQALATVPGAAEQFRSARSKHGAAMAMGGIGGAVLGFAIGYGLTREAGWENTQTLMAVGGGALAIVGAVLDNSANNTLRGAVEAYNAGAPRPISLRFAPTGRVGGAGVCVSLAF
jgi:hypothetical protein